jgi:hypothetical protein
MKLISYKHCLNVAILGLSVNVKGITSAENVSQYGAEEDIWALEGAAEGKW